MEAAVLSAVGKSQQRTRPRTGSHLPLRSRRLRPLELQGIVQDVEGLGRLLKRDRSQRAPLVVYQRSHRHRPTTTHRIRVAPRIQQRRVPELRQRKAPIIFTDGAVRPPFEAARWSLESPGTWFTSQFSDDVDSRPMVVLRFCDVSPVTPHTFWIVSENSIVVHVTGAPCDTTRGGAHPGASHRSP